MKKLLALAGISIFTAASVCGVILFRTGDPNANTAAPDMQTPHDGWDYEGNWGGYLGTPIAPHFFISAAHIGQAGGSTFTFQNSPYSVVQGFYDPYSDLVIWQVTETFTTFAPLYSQQNEVGQRTVDIGRGTQRGANYSLNNVPLGWLWGGQAGTERWGENNFASVFHYGTGWDLLYATFDQNGLPDECTLSVGDSGGAAFINDGGVWKLAGINYAVDGPYSETPDGASSFNAALFDTRGLYTQNGSQWVQITGPDPVPTGFYPTRISTKLDWIYSVIDPNGDADGDGVPNLLEYALHLNSAPPNYGAADLAIESGYIGLIYRKITSAPSLTYQVEQSSDLISWPPATSQDEVIATQGNVQTIKAKVAMNGATKLLLRLRITQQ